MRLEHLVARSYDTHIYHMNDRSLFYQSYFDNKFNFHIYHIRHFLYIMCHLEVNKIVIFEYILQLLSQLMCSKRIGQSLHRCHSYRQFLFPIYVKSTKFGQNVIKNFIKATLSFQQDTDPDIGSIPISRLLSWIA